MQEQTFSLSAAESPAAERAAFIRKTYGHLAVALLAFAGIECYLVNSPFAEEMAKSMTEGFTWLIVLGAFMFVGFVADRLAHSQSSESMQYLGLGLFVVAEAIIFLPLLFVANEFGEKGVISTAGIMTLLLVGGLTATVFITKKDFSFLRGILGIGFFVALGFIVCSVLFEFPLAGLLFSSVMILLAAGSILYTTSNILHHYHPRQHVAASLALFSAVALLFWYVLQLLMSFAGDD